MFRVNKTIPVLIGFVSVVFLVFLAHSYSESLDRQYGVFIGADSEDCDSIKKYETVVVDAEYLTKDDIAKLHQRKNKQIYSYINVGSIEKFRDNYSQMSDIVLDDYVNWSDEKWVDVTQKKWQDYVISHASSLSDKGVDGFFLDNFDVYYNYQTNEVYESLLAILDELDKLNKPIIINGADEFVIRAIDNSELGDSVYGINQESVFTKIDFENDRFIEQDDENLEFYKEYLNKAKEYGLNVFVIEYGATGDNLKKSKRYFKEKGFTYYFAGSINLDLDK